MNVFLVSWIYLISYACECSISDGCYGVQLRVNLLMQFMDQLEKLLYNAYEGCAVAMAAAPKVGIQCSVL